MGVREPLPYWSRKNSFTLSGGALAQALVPARVETTRLDHLEEASRNAEMSLWTPEVILAIWMRQRIELSHYSTKSKSD
jgi:hypothetical protein